MTPPQSIHTSVPHRPGPPPAASLAIGLLVLLAFVAVFLAAFKSPAPNRIDVAVVADPAEVSELQARLAQRQPGAFELDVHHSVDRARDALLARDVHAIFLPDNGRTAQLIVASAAAPAVADALEAAFTPLAAGFGQRLRVEDAKPLPESDSRGLAVFFLVLGTTIVSLLVGGLLHALGRETPVARVVALTCAWAAVAGATAVLTADSLVGAVPGSPSAYGLLSLLALAVAATTAGAAGWLGAPGVPLVALTMIVLGISTSGGPVGSPMQPGFFQALSEILPPGAGLEAVRGAVYFDDAGTLRPALVLTLWSLAGLMLMAGKGLRDRDAFPGRRAPDPASASA